MSWGATAYTPIIVYNNPPFGFHEVINPPDFKVCNENPWITGERNIYQMNKNLRKQEIENRLNTTKDNMEYGHDLDWEKKAKRWNLQWSNYANKLNTLKHCGCPWNYDCKCSTTIENFNSNPSNVMYIIFLIIIVLALYRLVK